MAELDEETQGEIYAFIQSKGESCPSDPKAKAKVERETGEKAEKEKGEKEDGENHPPETRKT